MAWISFEIDTQVEVELTIDKFLNKISDTSKQELFDTLKVRLQGKTWEKTIELPQRLETIETQADLMKLEFLASIFDKYTENQLRELLCQKEYTNLCTDI